MCIKGDLSCQKGAFAGRRTLNFSLILTSEGGILISGGGILKFEGGVMPSEGGTMHSEGGIMTALRM